MTRSAQPLSVTLDDGRTVTISAEVTEHGGSLMVQDAVIHWLGEVDRERVAALLKKAARVLEGQKVRRRT